MGAGWKIRPCAAHTACRTRIAAVLRGRGTRSSDWRMSAAPGVYAVEADPVRRPAAALTAEQRRSGDRSSSGVRPARLPSAICPLLSLELVLVLV